MESFKFTIVYFHFICIVGTLIWIHIFGIGNSVDTIHSRALDDCSEKKSFFANDCYFCRATPTSSHEFKIYWCDVIKIIWINGASGKHHSHFHFNFYACRSVQPSHEFDQVNMFLFLLSIAFVKQHLFTTALRVYYSQRKNTEYTPTKHKKKNGNKNTINNFESDTQLVWIH